MFYIAVCFSFSKIFVDRLTFFEAKVFFFADAVAYVFSDTYTYLLWKKFLKVLLFHQNSAKFAVEIKSFHFSHSYCKVSLKKKIAKLRRHNL